MFKVTCIDLDNGEFALYINGHYLISQDCSGGKMYAGDLLESLESMPGAVIEHVNRDLPENEDWCWNASPTLFFLPTVNTMTPQSAR